MRFRIFLYLVLINSYFLKAEIKDSLNNSQNSVLSYFEKGHFGGQIRNFTMSTINRGGLTDYYANAIGATVHYKTLDYKGFSVGLKGIFTFKLFSNNLNYKDPKAKRSSRYEKQLFDVEHENNYSDLDRLEKLYIKYDKNSFIIKVGKIGIKTPMVNGHDGRMKPKVFSGLWHENKVKDRLNYKVGWLSSSSPRSTTHWYSIGESIGIYQNGYLSDSLKADYRGYINSKGLGIVGLKYLYKAVQ